MICSRCGIESGNLFCSKCREEIEKKHKNFIPLLFWDKEHKCYRFGCSALNCPCNDYGICSTRFLSLKDLILHKFDFDNIIKNWCG